MKTKRTVKILIPVSELERDLFKKAAEIADTSMSEFVRQSVKKTALEVIQRSADL